MAVRKRVLPSRVPFPSLVRNVRAKLFSRCDRNETSLERDGFEYDSNEWKRHILTSGRGVRWYSRKRIDVVVGPRALQICSLVCRPVNRWRYSLNTPSAYDRTRVVKTVKRIRDNPSCKPSLRTRRHYRETTVIIVIIAVWTKM